MASNQSAPPHKRPKLDHEDGNTAETDVASHRTREKDVDISEKDVATPKKHINDLPKELLAKILGYLPRCDLVRNASAVCWRWHEAAFDQDNWKTIDVCVGDKMSVQDLSRLVKKSTKILRITTDENVLDGTFESVLEKSDTLHTLILNVQKSQQDSADTDLVVKMRRTRTSSQIVLRSIGQHCGESLRKLVLCKLDGLNDRILISILRSCNNLDQLFLGLCKNLSTSVLSVIGENASQLTQLVIRFTNDKRLSDHSIENLVVRCPKLKVLEIYANFSIHTDWKCVGKLQHLEVLGITMIDISDNNTGLLDDDIIIHWIKHCRHLNYLSMQSPLITDKALEVITLSKLRSFDMLISNRITPQGLELLATSTTVTSIMMIVLHDSINVVANDFVELAKNLKTLEALCLLFGHSENPLYKQMDEISSVWKGVYPISIKIW